ncbi:unnamed protein product [Pleuronectes platessa]|uniref:Uncharacterized protein n=1 Tax=Pleuronectes platessa TaxID=8262 RepID=A0A9N7YW08_PLEPL|nr:unnamed protein product [Pleuronectes platessa]
MPTSCPIPVLVSLTYPSSTSRKKPAIGFTEEERRDEMTSANATIMMVSHIARGLAGDLRGATAKKQVVKSGTASQRCGGEVCLQTAPSSAPKPQPLLSDVCVPSLMKKFWYLGETLLSAEQTLPPLCPRAPHSHTAAPHTTAVPSGLWSHLSGSS